MARGMQNCDAEINRLCGTDCIICMLERIGKTTESWSPIRDLEVRSYLSDFVE
jgi:hypothetical protein